MGKLRKHAALGAFLMICLPGLAQIVGKHSSNLENRVLASPPSKVSTRFFTDLGYFVNDRLPLRQEALRIDAWIDQNIFNEDPAFGGGASPRVIEGKDGFLFLADAIDNACTPNLQPEDTAIHFAHLSQVISRSGRRSIFSVAPDKSSIRYEKLPNDFPKKSCFAEYTNSLWTALERSKINGFINLRDLLIEESKKTRSSLYLRKDSHWDSAGSLVAVKRIVTTFNKNVWNESEVHFDGLVSYQGDLTGLRGLPETDETPKYSIIREQVKIKSIVDLPEFDFEGNVRVKRIGPPNSLIKGRTLFLLDSFGLAALPQLAPYFEDLTTVRIMDYDKYKFTKLIDDADNVIVMSVERSLGYRMLMESGSSEFIQYLETHLSKR